MIPAFATSKRFLIGAAIVLGLVLVGLATYSAVSYFRTAAYEKREAGREAERQAWEQERKGLVAEREKYRIEAAENQAMADAMRQVAETKRADRQQTVKELEQLEVDHEKRKAELETSSGTLSDTALADELCRRMRARGYKCTE